MRLNKVSAISFDLDDTLWPFGPAVTRAEAALHAWLLEQAPGTALALPTAQALRTLRDEHELSRPDLAGNFRALRLGSIRLALELAKEDVALADAAYEVFYLARQKVEFYEDVLPALNWLGARFPLVAVTNGNADLKLTGCGEFFRAHLSAEGFGCGKPDAGIFLEAAMSVGVPPGELLHVGDDFDLDVVGALNAGLQAAWLVRDGFTEAEAGSSKASRPHLTIRDLAMLCQVLGGPRSVALAGER
ncbi:HAD family hydrolase [Burkholderia sp. SRS-W-2-2016]|uniref:HAD family hydrolase n=1 Tax=Burkholderia sp. SRS-W-2-2016 TaxID=1926878 RepID=UPI00094B3743|nr:HAD-IA family hydrolase [Burkholderia sp. SRS-W-2-2016]OLL31028.1 HAD family hydrolase [Burkholderia sp. SRS-W-2-2016]